MTKKEESEQIKSTEEENSKNIEASVSSEEVTEPKEEVAIPREEVAVPSEEDLLLPRDVLLSAGLHIGTRMKTKDMDEFIYRVRPDGLFVLDVKRTDERIRVAAKFLSRFEPDRIAAVASRLYARYPAKKFCEITKATPIAGRFVPGQFSNPLYADHIEPAIIIVSDPKADVQAVREAGIMGIPVIALCSTDNDFAGIDFVIPTNNKGRRALAVIYWMLARQLLREKGELTPDKDIDLSVEDFEARIPQG